VYLLLPQIPMLFMGEEWASRQPFPFFCDFQGELAQAIRNGRREEFSQFPEFRDPAMQERIPDPLADATFLAAKLDWDALKNEDGLATLQWYRRILSVRMAEIVPYIPDLRSGGIYEVLGPGAVEVTWSVGSDRQLRLRANLSRNAQGTFTTEGERTVWSEGVAADVIELPPWSVIWSIVRR
jgi:1,4-alpha-glucan branching enzyme